MYMKEKSVNVHFVFVFQTKKPRVVPTPAVGEDAAVTALSVQPCEVEQVPYRSSMTEEQVPDSALDLVLQWVPVRDRIVAERVSRRWYQLVQESWKQLRHLDFGHVISRSWERHGEPTAEPQILLLTVLSRVGQFITSLDFSNCSPFRLSHYSLELIGQFCPALVELNLSGRTITAKGLDGLRNLPLTLQRLRVTRCFESGSYETKKAVDRALSSLLPSLPNLTHLYAEHNKSEQCWGKGGVWVARLKLHSLAVGHCAVNADAFSSFLSNNVGHIREFRASEATFASGNWSNIDLCRQLLKKALVHWRSHLQVLELRDFAGSYGSVLGEAVKLLPTLTGLQSLSLKANRFVDDQLLASICESCTALHTLSLACCHGVKRKGLAALVQLPNLKSVHIFLLLAPCTLCFTVITKYECVSCEGVLDCYVGCLLA